MRRFFFSVRRYFRLLDKTLLFLCLSASFYGLVLIYTATFSYNTIDYVRTQALALGIGLVSYLALSPIDPGDAGRFWPLLLALNLAFLSTLYFWGVGESNHSWLRFGGIGVQPAELGKPVFILTFSRHLDLARKKGMRFRDLLGLALHAGTVIAFVLLFSRDDGMSLAYACIALSMAFAAGAGLAYFLAMAAALGALAPYLWTDVLEAYQRERILAVFQPEAYPAGAYQANHSRMAIRAGGLLGEGFLSGTQTQHSLIPTKHTDSIFPVACEEFGLIGGLVLIALLLAILLRVCHTLRRTKAGADRLLLTGVAAMLAFQTILNLGMNLGIFPIVGLTLPFFSYGGSSLVTMFVCAALSGAVRRQNLLSVSNKDFHIRRYP